jgi:hypothetical protein
MLPLLLISIFYYAFHYFISFDCAIPPGCHFWLLPCYAISRHYFVDAVCPMFFDLASASGFRLLPLPRLIFITADFRSFAVSLPAAAICRLHYIFA